MLDGDRESPRLGLALRAPPVSEHLMRLLDQLERLQRDPPRSLPIRSGIPALDALLPRTHPLLHVVTGRRSVGKTALALRIALECARAGVPVSIYSLEGAPSVLAARLLAGANGIDWRRALNCALSRPDWETLARTAEELGRLPIRIVDAPFASADVVAATERTAEAEGFRSAITVVDGVRRADSALLNSLVRLSSDLGRAVFATVDHPRTARRSTASLRLPLPDHAFVLHLERDVHDEPSPDVRPVMLRVGQQWDALRDISLGLVARTSWFEPA